VKVAAGVAGVVLIAGSASWAVAASSGTRLPGQEITGQALGSEAVAQHIQNATTDAERSDIVGAIKEYQKVLAADPNQVQALTGEGWLLAETGQPGLLKQGLALLTRAEQVQPAYAPAHVYRGIALLSEADYGDSMPELQWYLDHNPDPQLVAQVRKALTQAKAGAAAEAAGPTPAPATSGTR
jgi:tetratricopeptide (TPR) repeat protein